MTESTYREARRAQRVVPSLSRMSSACRRRPSERASGADQVHSLTRTGVRRRLPVRADFNRQKNDLFL